MMGSVNGVAGLLGGALASFGHGSYKDLMSTLPSHIFSVAPMMDWTDRHCRSFHRTLTSRALLYTEMVTTGAILHGDKQRLIGFDPVEHPVALQLGGSDPTDLAACAKIAEDWGYDEVNLNVGCPSDRVQNGRFGACLMKEPGLVAECLSAMRAAVRIPVTVKSRIGVDDQDPETALFGFVDTVAKAGVTTFIVHARKAWLKGLSPKENREVPPLDYDLVYRLKAARPDLTIVLNGGLTTLDQAKVALENADGVMFGRAAYQDPWVLAAVNSELFRTRTKIESPESAVEAYKPYLAARLSEGVPLHAMTRHMLGLFNGRPGARLWRRVLSERGVLKGAGLDVVDAALDAVAAAKQSVAA
jgi:tRNA-dihydrouridine synthase A